MTIIRDLVAQKAGCVVDRREQCISPSCLQNFQSGGYAVGCSLLEQGRSSYPPGRNARYSFPGPCPLSAEGAKTEECLEDYPGGLCDQPDGTENCTFHLEDAGYVTLDELSGRNQSLDFADWCAQGFREWEPSTDRGVGMSFWDNLHNGAMGKETTPGGVPPLSLKLPSVRDTFPSAVLASISVWPFESGEVSVQCYNAALTLAAIYEHADLAVVCENERYLDLCRLSLGEAHPSLSSLNGAIAENLVRVLMPCKSVRAQHGPGCSLLQLVGQLCAHPLYRLTTVRSLPQTRRGAEAFTSDSWLALQRRLLQLSETGALVDRSVRRAAGPSQPPSSCGARAPPTHQWIRCGSCPSGSSPLTPCRCTQTRIRWVAWSEVWLRSATARPWCRLSPRLLHERQPCCGPRHTYTSTSGMAWVGRT
ncbi:tubd1 [Symbiodinium natans]|uniref:Tubd1 protein n=1 Tax=Symbiodinium natans TaxID=878477 RepID=A0A812S8H9_9DINO|nr:tubd1 [Symbiodinium natans]